MTVNENEIVEVYDSYKFSYGTIIAFLKSRLGKLPNSTILEDQSKRQWEIKKFYWSTGSPESYEMTQVEQQQGIFQYVVEGINHDEKPPKGSKLEIISKCA